MREMNTVLSSTRQRPGSRSGMPAVPWLTVVPLAVLMAYGDGFWMTSLRGAAGAIERTQGPFASWLRESTLLLPVFVLAVLGALTLAMRCFGPVLGTARTILATGLMVVGAGTLAGVITLAASSAYDYSLQSSQLQMVASMGDLCGAVDCLAQQQQATLALQMQAVGYGSATILVTNLVLVGWAVALHGGRLDVRTARSRPAKRTTGPRGAGVLPHLALRASPVRRVDDLSLILTAGLLGCAAIHAAVVPEHLTEWGAAGLFFIVLAAAELVLALLLVRPRSTQLRSLRQRILLAAAVVSVGPLMLWLYSRTLGMPFGPEHGVPEAVGLADAASSLLEVGTLLIAFVLLRGREWTRGSAASAHVRWLILLAVLAVTAIGLGGSDLVWFDVLGDVRNNPGMHSPH